MTLAPEPLHEKACPRIGHLYVATGSGAPHRADQRSSGLCLAAVLIGAFTPKLEGPGHVCQLLDESRNKRPISVACC